MLTWRNGIRKRLKISRGNPCQFESDSEHQYCACSLTVKPTAHNSFYMGSSPIGRTNATR